ncbi:MAG: hypothetical protein ACK55I_42915, partial [bacterium]
RITQQRGDIADDADEFRLSQPHWSFHQFRKYLGTLIYQKCYLGINMANLRVELVDFLGFSKMKLNR